MPFSIKGVKIPIHKVESICYNIRKRILYLNFKGPFSRPLQGNRKRWPIIPFRCKHLHAIISASGYYIQSLRRTSPPGAATGSNAQLYHSAIASWYNVPSILSMRTIFNPHAQAPTVAAGQCGRRPFSTGCPLSELLLGGTQIYRQPIGDSIRDVHWHFCPGSFLPVPFCHK